MVVGDVVAVVVILVVTITIKFIYYWYGADMFLDTGSTPTHNRHRSGMDAFRLDSGRIQPAGRPASVGHGRRPTEPAG